MCVCVFFSKCVCLYVCFTALTASLVSLHPSCNRLKTAPIDRFSLPSIPPFDPAPVSIPIPIPVTSLIPAAPVGPVCGIVPGLFLGDVISLLEPDEDRDRVRAFGEVGICPNPNPLSDPFAPVPFLSPKGLRGCGEHVIPLGLKGGGGEQIPLGLRGGGGEQIPLGLKGGGGEQIPLGLKGC